jgi:hypothetical protein
MGKMQTRISSSQKRKCRLSSAPQIKRRIWESRVAVFD